MNYLERFLTVMEHQPVDQAPDWEAGVRPQTRERWDYVLHKTQAGFARRQARR